MDEMLNSLTALLANVVLPTLRTVQNNQAGQLEQNAELRAAIDELREFITMQFNHLNCQLQTNFDELRALNEALLMLKLEQSALSQKQINLIH